MEETALIANVATAVGIVLVWIQLLLTNKELKADHERSRRENAVNLLLEWSSRMSDVGSLSRKFGEAISEKQADKLVRLEPFEVNIEQAKLANQILGRLNVEQIEIENTEICLTYEQVLAIQWQITLYLNTLESIMTAWLKSVADRVTLEEQFGYLTRRSGSNCVMKNVREAMGGDEVLPAIAAFIKELEQKKNSALDGKHHAPVA